MVESSRPEPSREHASRGGAARGQGTRQDDPQPRGTSPRRATSDVALVAVFAAFIAACALVPAIQLPGVPVPFTLQTLGVALTGMVLGASRGFLAAALYVVAGLAGLPIFAGYSGGVGVLARGSAGYLLAFPVAALLIGFLVEQVVRRGFTRRWLWFALAGLVGSIVVVHPLGILGIMRNARLSIEQAFLVDVVFWPWDIVKTVIAAGIAVSVHRAFPALVVRRAVRRDAAWSPAA